MIPSDPLVSICIPTFNRASMVADAIRSALGQSYRNIEVLVVDNASTDTILDVVATFPDPRLKLVVNPHNLGLFGNFNRCIELAQGKYVHILHSDDSIDPDFTETCVRFLEENPSVAMTFTPALFVRDQSRTLQQTFPETHIFRAPEGFCDILLKRNFIICPSVMVRKEVYSRVGPFSLDYPYSSDYYQWLKIARAYDIAYVATTKVIYRQGEHSESFRLQFMSMAGYLDTEKIYLQLLGDLGEETSRYTPELNTALYTFIKDSMFAGFTRADRIKIGNVTVIWGVCIGVWSLIPSYSVMSWIKKAISLPLILVIGILMHLSPARWLVSTVFRSRTNLY